MPKISRSRALVITAGAVAVLTLAWLAWPAAAPVDLATVSRTRMEVTVDEDARTRVQHIYTVSAPLTGTVQRPPGEVGDKVTENDTIVAVMRPAGSSFHDPRLHQELLSALAAADAAVVLADAERRKVETSLNLAATELGRMQKLAAEGAVSRSVLDKAVADAKTGQAALASAMAALQVRRNERASAAARVQNPMDGAVKSMDSNCCVQIRSPVTGQILRRTQGSEAVVQAGTPLVDIGNPQDLEVVAELLSTDAVQVRQGQMVHIDGWGGATIHGRVRRIEPAGFLKVSALGIEEQRVRTIIDFADPPSQRPNLGHDYRVIVHVVTWMGDNVLTVPIGALFRVGDQWAVFRNEGGRARVAKITIGHRNNRFAEVLSGLSQGDQVVLHASDRVSEGSRIAQRE